MFGRSGHVLVRYAVFGRCVGRCDLGVSLGWPHTQFRVFFFPFSFLCRGLFLFWLSLRKLFSALWTARCLIKRILFSCVFDLLYSDISPFLTSNVLFYQLIHMANWGKITTQLSPNKRGSSGASGSLVPVQGAALPSPWANLGGTSHLAPRQSIALAA